MRSRIRCGLCVALFLAIMGVGASSALAASAWWHLSAGTVPTDVQLGKATDEVQRVTVSASTTVYELEDRGIGPLSREDNALRVTLARGEEPAGVQGALEGLYGTGNVEVSELSPSSPGEQVLDVKFVGGLADLPVTLMRHFGNENEVQLKEITTGRPDAEISVSAANLGDATTQTPVTVSDVLPPGWRALKVEGSVNENASGFFFGNKASPLECSLSASKREATCPFSGAPPPQLETLCPRCEAAEYPKFVPPYESLRMVVAANAVGASSGETNVASVKGGGAPGAGIPSATVRAGIPLSPTPTPFGVSAYELRPENEGAGLDRQAGSHPFQLTTIANLNTTFDLRDRFSTSSAGGLAKDVHVKLPAGLIGNPTVIPRCPLGRFLESISSHQECPANTAVGVARVTLNIFNAGHTTSPFIQTVYNLEPAAGEPARFGFIVDGNPVLLDAAVRTGGDYGVTVSSTNISEQVEFLSNEVTFWGVPGSQAHNASRGDNCLLFAQFAARGEGLGECPPFSESSPPPLITLPTSCSGAPLMTSVEADSWQEPRNALSFSNTEPMVALDGCNRLPFAPEIKVTPDATAASSPAGLNVDVHVPQEGQLNPEGLAQSNVKDITVALPEGVMVNPAGGDGLAACSEGLVGFSKFEEQPLEPGLSLPGFTRFIPGDLASQVAVERGEAPAEDKTFKQGIDFCADASKIGEVTIRSPLLPPGQLIRGFVYLATQNENPFGSLIALYIVAEDPISGTVVKLPGEVHLSESGQIIGTFKDNPQLAFEDAELHFFGGERAPLSSPSRCGAYTTNATFTPWSGNPPAHASSTFDITTGPHGGACTYQGQALPFSPSLKGGTTSNNAGGFSPLTTTIGRQDGQQDMQSVQIHMPPGVSGLLSSVQLCPEAQANEGTCGPESLIGETTVSAGVGNDPVSVTGGRVYITEHYAGAPFGLSVVNPVKAGPFDLEHDTSNPAQNPPCDCIVVRAKIEVDPHTAALTVTTDPSGPHAIPHLIDGIPVQIQKVNVLVNRPNFTFNPTSCNPLSLTGTIASDEGASSPVSLPFQVANCALLGFKPDFKVGVTGKFTKQSGVALSTTIVNPTTAPGGQASSQAGFAHVKVELPKQLPSRLETLQQACLAATFEANFRACPAHSFVGHAKVITPLLPVALEGPAIFVSHGAEAFPDLTIVLQGYGVTVDLVGTTFISRAGVTSTTFKATPDVPFKTFELTLPQGPYSALTANTSLCAGKTTTVKRRATVHRHGRTLHVVRKVKVHSPLSLVMPTEFIAQNGAAIHQNTPIKISGCAGARKASRARKALLRRSGRVYRG